MKCKCIDCNKRELGCHAKCKDYLEFREYLNKKRLKERSEHVDTSTGWGFIPRRSHKNG